MIVGVLPAAGFATRLQPLAGSKEVVSVAGKPVMDHVVARMRMGGADEIRIVTRPEKVDVIEHARASGLTVLEARPDTVSASVRAGLEGLDEDDVVLLGLPDTLWEPVDGFLALRRALGQKARLALGLFRGRELERSDVVTVDASGLVTGVDVKPAAPRSEWVWGCAAAEARVLWDIESHAEPGSFFAWVAERERVIGVKLSDVFLDIGTQDVLSQVSP